MAGPGRCPDRSGPSCISSECDCLPMTVGDPYSDGKRPARIEGAGVSDEEVQRVKNALDEVEKIADPEARVRAQSRIMAAQVKRNREWAAERKELVIQLWDGGNGLSYRQIADRLNIKLSTVQDIFRGYTGSGTARPKSKPPEERS